MTSNTGLLEPSFADLITAIEQTSDLSQQTRRHWSCSARQIARWLDRPAAVIPARFNAVAMPVRQLHHARVGVTAKTLANHMLQASKRGAPKGSWLEQMLARKPRMLVTVALANKTARIIWACTAPGSLDTSLI